MKSPLKRELRSKEMLTALLRQLEEDRGSYYWTRREEEGLHDPECISAWLSSLIDCRWTP